MKVSLTYLNGHRKGQTEEYALPVIQVGRGLESDVRLGDDPELSRVASRQHAELRRENNQLVLLDVGSRNGTLVNGQRVSRAVLSNGDQIEFGAGGPSFQVFISLSETEEIDFLRSSHVFGGLDEQTLLKVVSAGTLEVFPADSYLFRVNQACEALYVVKSGVVEVWRDTDNDGELDVVTYLGVGDDLSSAIILIDEVSHQSAARIPEGAVVLKLTRKAFRELILATPELALSVCTSLAVQLERTYKKLKTQAYKRLQGNLNFFDLATVVQTLMSSFQTGILSITPLEIGFARSGLWASSDDIEMPAAMIQLMSGQLVYARCGILSAEEAFFQLFQMEHHGSFMFHEGDAPPTFVPQRTIQLPGFDLLLEAIRFQDELKVLKSELTDPKLRYAAFAPRLNWREETYGEAAKLIWNKLLDGASISDLQGEIPYSDFAIYFVVSILLKSGHIRPDDGRCGEITVAG